MEIKWIQRNRKHHPRGCCGDVGVIVSPKDKIIRLSFRNNCEKKITKGDYAVVGYADQKLFFKGCDECDGLKFTHTSKTSNRYLRINNREMYEALKLCSGEYELFFDRENKLYYIDFNENQKPWERERF